MKYPAVQEGRPEKKSAKAAGHDLFFRVEEQLNVRQVLAKKKPVCTLKSLIYRK